MGDQANQTAAAAATRHTESLQAITKPAGISPPEGALEVASAPHDLALLERFGLSAETANKMAEYQAERKKGRMVAAGNRVCTTSTCASGRNAQNTAATPRVAKACEAI